MRLPFLTIFLVLASTAFILAQVDSVVVFNEIHYHPADDVAGTEFIELYNQNSVPVDLSGWTLEGAGSFSFAKGAWIEGRSYLVLAKDPAALGVAAIGALSGSVGNAGEQLTLRNHNQRIMDRVDFGDSRPWPSGPDGSGATLAKRVASTSSSSAAHWTTSATLGGTPGEENSVVAAADLVVFSEVPGSTESSFWLELHNPGDQSVDLTTLECFSGTGETVLLEGSLGSQEFRQVMLESLPTPGTRFFLTQPSSNAYLDTVIVQDHPRARLEFPHGRFLQPDATTPGAVNSVALDNRIVINEIMYHHRPNYQDPADPTSRYRPNDEEWLELINHSDTEVDLSGWRLRDGIRYDFDQGVRLDPGAYLVVGKDLETLQAKYPEVAMVGGYQGSLTNSGDRVELQDPLGNPVDVVQYRDDQPWPAEADGQGSSMELKHPQMDNITPGAWAASDESVNSEWHTYTYRAKAERPVYTAGVRNFDELRVGFLQAGRCLMDNVSVIEDPDGPKRQLVRNRTFGSLFAPITSSGWRLLGTHSLSEAVSEPDTGSVLKIEAASTMNYLNNLCEADLTSPIQIGTDYEISFDAKWLGGSPQLRTEGYYNQFAKKHILHMPDKHGTPGRQNTAYVVLPQPTFGDLLHSPAVPSASDAIEVSVQADSTNDLKRITLVYSADEEDWQTVPMSLSNERYRAKVPPQSNGTVVQFYVEAEDSEGGVATFPAEGPTSGAFAKVDGVAPTDRRQSMRLITRHSDASGLHARIDILSNLRRDCTVIMNETEIFYNCGVRLRGSMFSRSGGGQSGLNIKFPADQLFRGTQSTIIVRLRNPQEILVKHMANQAINVPASYNDFVELRGYRNGQSGLGRMEMSRFGENYLAGAFEDGASSPMFKMEGIRDFLTAGAGGVKNPQPVGWIVQFDLEDLGDDKEQYRHVLRLISARKQDDYTGIMAMAKAFGAPDETLRESVESILDTDQWTRMMAIMSLCGIADVYPVENPHNFNFYRRPTDGKFIALPWDWDFTFNLAASSRIIDPKNSRKNLWRMLKAPGINRLYRGHMLDLIDTVYNERYAREWFDRYAEVAGVSYNSSISYVRSRSSSVKTQASAPTTFSITSNDGKDFAVDSPEVALQGKGGVRILTIEHVESGLQIRPDWLDDETWQLTLPLSEEINKITLQARDYQGSTGSLFVPTGLDVVTVTNTSGLDAPRSATLHISEIMYHPAEPLEEEIAAGFEDQNAFEYIELLNTGTRTLDLSGVGFSSGVQLNLKDGASLAPGAYGLLVANRAAFEFRYGGGLPILGSYTGRLANSGERLTLSGSHRRIIQQIRYHDTAPWPEAADGEGLSLSLINVLPETDPALAESWKASSANPGEGPSDLVFQGLSYAEWADAAFAVTDAKAFDQDADGDGFVNGIEFALASDPKDSTSVPSITVSDNDEGISLRYTRRGNAEADVQVETSIALSNWQPLTQGQVNPASDSVSVKLGDLENGIHLRLKVSLIAP